MQKGLVDKLRLTKDLVVEKATIDIFMGNLAYVNDFEVEFFNKFWEYFNHIIELATKRPQFLVKLLRLIEEDQLYLFDIKQQLKNIIVYVL